MSSLLKYFYAGICMDQNQDTQIYGISYRWIETKMIDHIANFSL